jgi:hypothetical protein
MTKARDLANFNVSGVLTSTSTLNPANLDSTGTIPSALLAGVGGGENTPAFHTYLSSSTQNAHVQWFQAPLASEKFDTGNAFNTSTHKFVVPSGSQGKYNLYTKCGFVNNNGTWVVQMWASIRVNGTDKAVFGFDSNQANHTKQDSIGGSLVIDLSEGDEVEVYCYGETDNTADIRLLGGEDTTYFGGFKLAE